MKWSSLRLRQGLGFSLVMCLWLLPALAWAKPTGGLVLAAQVWGLVKYHAPDVTACTMDWDQVLLDQFTQLESAASGSAADETAALDALVKAAGTVGSAALADDTPAWIRDADIDADLKQKLAWLALQRPDQQCYVTLTYGLLDFGSDSGHGVTGLPDRAHRALAAFRFWNVVRYFYPYKSGIGRDWPDVLQQWLPAVLDAGDYAAYIRALRGLTAAIRDGHDFLNYHYAYALDLIPKLPPFDVHRIQGKPVVVRVLPEAGAVQPGDVVLDVDGTPMAERMTHWAAMSWGANPAWRDAENLRLAIGGAVETGTYRLRRPDGSVYTVQLPRSWSYNAGALQGISTAWETRSLPGGCQMGIVNMGRLQPEQVDAFAHAMTDVDAIIFDSRNYPNGTVWPLANYLFAQPRPIARFEVADLHHPGTFNLLDNPANALGGHGTPSLADKRLLVLVNGDTMSQAEYTVMGLQATGNAIVFGSQTSGSDGDILHPPLDLPGEVTITFTGLRTSYPDGTPTQRIGIVPDVQVTPTIAGLAAGKDEVLDAALNCGWVDAAPLRRKPVTGLYSDTSHQGASVDLHDNGRSVMAFATNYDQQGQPNWRLAATSAIAADLGSRFQSDPLGTPGSMGVTAYSVDFQRGPYAPPCAMVDQSASALFPRALWKSPTTGAAGHCVTPQVLSTGGRAAGVWSGPDGGWALSIQPEGTTLHAHLYGFDQQGEPRWLKGSGTLDDNGVAEIALQRGHGYCNTCAPIALTEQPAGSIRLTVGAAGGGGASADIEVWFGSQSPWVRTAVPLHRVMRKIGTAPTVTASQRVQTSVAAPGNRHERNAYHAWLEANDPN